MLSEWHDFFIALAAAAGTLIGAMFVVVSIGGGLVKGSALPSRIFVTPIIIHLAVVLLACVSVLAPALTRRELGAAAGVTGIVFLGYAGRNAFHISQRDQIEWSDHLWYSLTPVVAYLVMIAGAVMVLEDMPGCIAVIGLALVLLVISGIRNAWDLILFFLEKRNGGETSPPP